MPRKTIIALILGLVLLAACQTASPSPTATALPASSTPTTAPAATHTPPPTPTQPPPTDTPPPTATFTPALPTDTPLPPTNAPDCTNQASFVADITVPDESVVEAGMTFTKTWRIRNTGTCVWSAGYTLDYYAGDVLSATVPISMPVTLPGEMTDISIALTAPKEEGLYQGYFVIKNPQGLIMAIGEDSRLWVVIQAKADVQGLLTPTPTPTLTPSATATPEATPSPTPTP